MLVRVVRQPSGMVDRVSLHHYRPGRAYDLDPSLAEYLILNGFAFVEMRRADRSRRFRPTDRRRKQSNW
jgi:hypothetical protein